jgi:hypothetical protein
MKADCCKPTNDPTDRCTDDVNNTFTPIVERHLTRESDVHNVLEAVEATIFTLFEDPTVPNDAPSITSIFLPVDGTLLGLELLDIKGSEKEATHFEEL